MFRFNRYLRVILPALAVVWTACDMSVTNPGPIPDEDLNTPSAMPGLVVGMAGDLAVALGEQAYFSALMADEMAHSGNYNNERYFYQDSVKPEHANGVWANMQRARWVAESGIERMQRVLGDTYDSSPLAARAHLLAGYANRLAGENVCHAVFDGGPKQDFTAHFERAEGQFTEALNRALALDDQTLATAARAGRASVRAWLGDWTNAAVDAEAVPVGFVYESIFSLTDQTNPIYYETNNRREVTVFNTPWAEVFGDPRVPWDTVKTTQGALQTGQDGRTTFFRQGKYRALDSNIPLAKGTEMLLLRAEAVIRGGDFDDAMLLVNEARAFQGLADLTAADEAEAWTILRQERGAVLWLEARRIWDLRRWYAAGEIGAWKTGDLNLCVPISRNEEMANKNL